MKINERDVRSFRGSGTSAAARRSRDKGWYRSGGSLTATEAEKVAQSSVLDRLALKPALDVTRDAANLRRFAEPLPDPLAPDFALAFDRFADARIVLLGEATHGTAEFYDARAAITRRLIEKHGFTIVAVEADWPASRGAVCALPDLDVAQRGSRCLRRMAAPA